MKADKIYKDLQFSTDFSVDDWNALLRLKLAKYFNDDFILEKNKETLRAEIINYLQLASKQEYFKLFEWTFNVYKECVASEKQRIIKVLADSFNDISKTDEKWMINVLTKPDENEFPEWDKINYYFKVIEETLEGVFKPRFKLLDILVNYKLNNINPNNSAASLGQVIRDFPNEVRNETSLFLQDPLFSIPTNQWRNIASHKTFTINKNEIVVEYGLKNIKTVTLTYDQFYRIVYWTQDIYRAIRFGQVLFYLNFMEDVLVEIGETENIHIRYEASLLRIIHNMQIVGFEFVSTEEQDDIFCLNFKGKVGYDIKSSLIHASQCLDQISCAIDSDMFMKGTFKESKVSIVDNNRKILGSATISIKAAIDMAGDKMSINEYLSNMVFDINEVV